MNWDEICAQKPRKRRAIGLLASKILEHLPDCPKEGERWEMTVKQVMRKFDARRGAVYEVFHVFESLLLISKIGVNSFQWNGFSNLTQTLCLLRFIGLALNIQSDIAKTKELEVSEIVMREHRKTRGLFDMAKDRGDHLPNYIQEIMPLDQDDSPPLVQSSRHILEVCQRFMILFLISEEPKVMSLEFASKVINGTNFSPSLQRSKARRLYDVSNVLIAISERFPVLKKVNTTRVNSGCRTIFQYCGPKVEQIPLDYLSVMNFPIYRRKFLLFDWGKSQLGIPINPEKIEGLTTLRIRPSETPWPWPINTNHDVDMKVATVGDLRAPLSFEDIVKIETSRLGLTYIIPDDTDDDKAPKLQALEQDVPGKSPKNEDNEENIVMGSNEDKAVDETEVADKPGNNNDVNDDVVKEPNADSSSAAEPVYVDMALLPWAILPNQLTISEVFQEKL